MESPLNSGLNYSNPRFIIFCTSFNIYKMFRFKDFFNLTMTYRLDSDLVRPYGWFSLLQNTSKPLRKPNKIQDSSKAKIIHPIQEISWLTPTAPSEEVRTAVKLLEKPKLVAWMASNCATHSDREDYVEQLKKHIKVFFNNVVLIDFSSLCKVDVFGECGKKKCGPSNGGASNLKCDEMIEKNYKFFLAFENSICTDYVTEKFFRTLSRCTDAYCMWRCTYLINYPN